MTKIVGVLLPMPFNEPFDYKADDDVCVGEYVLVPFGKEVVVGVVWKEGRSSKLADNKIKLSRIIDLIKERLSFFI